MTDRTHPDSGRTTSQTHIIRFALELALLWIDGSGRDKVREALDALDTLEAQLESIGAGGVSGPLVGRNPEGISRDDTVHGESYFTAADMATASAQGFRDGAASVSASVGDLSSLLSAGVPTGYWDGEFSDVGCALLYEVPQVSAFGRQYRNAPLYTHPSPQEGVVMVPKEPTRAMQIAAKRADMDHSSLADWLVSDWPEFKRIWDAMIAAATPTSSADSKGE